jgi:hypothetical protein
VTCTAWVESLNTRDDSRGRTYRSSKKYGSLPLLHLLSTGCHCANNCQGQLQTPQSLSVVSFTANEYEKLPLVEDALVSRNVGLVIRLVDRYTGDLSALVVRDWQRMK